MINETALLESKALRDSALERTDVLDKVKTLSLLPDGMHVMTAMVATYSKSPRQSSTTCSTATAKSSSPTACTSSPALTCANIRTST
ncbi:hypothetical protein OG241_28530 [Streptomyces sp. NBC_01390]|uniref:hypothetical protein n=1 Tax=Streptomyces sp. NBC_01390 TaxID=2903850 RepID=UPI0032510078